MSEHDTIDGASQAELAADAVLAQVEADLQQLSAAAAAEPWLALKVENALATRERARRWLNSHPRGLLGLGGLAANRGDWRKWALQLAVVAGGAGSAALVCSLVLRLVPVALPAPVQLDPLLLASGAGGLLALAVLRWPELHGSYTA